MNTLEQILIGVFVLAIVAVVVSNGAAATAVGAMGQFLVNMVQKINGSTLT